MADELGVIPNNAHQLLFHMRRRLGAGVRAWVLFAGGDPDCDSLATELRAAEPEWLSDRLCDGLGEQA